MGVPIPVSVTIFIILLMIYEFRKEDKKKKERREESRRRYEENKRLPPIPTEPPSTDLNKIKAVVDAHRGWTAEIFRPNISFKEDNRVTMKHIPGDPVELRLDRTGMLVDFYMDGKYITKMFPPKYVLLDEFSLYKVLNSKAPCHAYMFRRDFEAIKKTQLDVFDIIVFYKMDGVPPTDVEL